MAQHPLDRLSAKEWYSGSSTLSTVTPGTLSPTGNTGFAAIMSAWSGGCYDTTRERLLIWGGGHADYPGNEIYAYDIHAMTWSRVWGPSANGTFSVDGLPHETYTDGNPAARHTYSGLAYLPDVDTMVTQAGSRWNNGDGTQVVWKHNFGTGTWSQGPSTASNEIRGKLAYDSVTGHIFAQNELGGKFQEYNHSAGTWTNRGDISGVLNGANSTAAIDPVRRLYVLMGGVDRVHVWNLSSFAHTTPTTTGAGSIMETASAPGFVYDSNRQTFVAWDGGATVYELNPDTWAWTTHSAAATNTVTPTSTQGNGTFGRFQYIASKDAYVAVNDYNGPTYFFRLSPSGSEVGFTLQTNAATGTYPFCIGHPFVKGAVPSGTYVTSTNLSACSVVPLRTWNDGSLKHAIIAGRVALSQSVETQINLMVTNYATSGTALTAGNITALSPTATIALVGFGTITLGDMLASPTRTFVSCPEMVECHYGKSVGAGTQLFGWFHVRLFADNRMRIRATVVNGAIEDASATHATEVLKDYTATVVVNGSTILNQLYHHYPHSRWDAFGWIGGDPQITPRHDTGYLNRTKLVPNLWKTGPSNTTMSAYGSLSYSVGSHLSFTMDMGDAGYQDQIGLLTHWDAMYLSSQGDRRMYKAVVENARAVNSYGMIYVDRATGNPINPASYPTHTIDGAGGGGGNVQPTKTQDQVNNLQWEGAHAPTAGYLAYMLTGDYYYLETMKFGANAYFVCTSSLYGSGLSRTIETQIRGRAWGYRNLAQCCALAPTAQSAIFANTQTWWSNMMVSRVAQYVTPATPTSLFLGYEDSIMNRLSNGVALNGQNCLRISPWECHFLTGAMGLAVDVEPVASMTATTVFANFVAAAPVWIMGGSATTEYNFGYAAEYEINIRTDANFTEFNPPTFSHYSAANPGIIFNDTYAVDSTTVVNATTHTLIASDPSVGTAYWANLLPALAYAVDHSRSGADASWTRFSTASNFAAQDVTADYANTPQWGVVPRSYLQPSIVFSVTAGEAVSFSSSGTSSTTGGASTNVFFCYFMLSR